MPDRRAGRTVFRWRYFGATAPPFHGIAWDVLPLLSLRRAEQIFAESGIRREFVRMDAPKQGMFALTILPRNFPLGKMQAW